MEGLGVGGEPLVGKRQGGAAAAVKEEAGGTHGGDEPGIDVEGVRELAGLEQGVFREEGTRLDGRGHAVRKDSEKGRL